MYRTQRKQSFRYECGLYQPSHGAQCSYNHVDGPKAASYALAAVRQKVLCSGAIDLLTATIRSKLEDQIKSPHSAEEHAAVTSQLATIQGELQLVKTNLGRAKSDEQYNEIATQFDDLNARKVALTERLSQIAAQTNHIDVDAKLERSLEAFKEVQQLAEQAEDLAGATRLFDALNVQLFLRFQPVQKKRRFENKLAGGSIIWGSAEPPIRKYTGPTGKQALKELQARQASENRVLELSISTDGRNESLGNVSRGDRS
jgi:hypothetical protein